MSEADTGTGPSGSGSTARRRQANAAGGRRRKHEVKVTEVEGDALAARAAELAVSVPRLLVESALAPAGETASERRAAMAELFAARRLLSAVSNNVNQVAKATNATHEVQAELVATLAAVRTVVFRIDECLEAVGGRGKVGRR